MTDPLESETLIIIEAVNFAITLAFLGLFSYRLRYLQPFSRTNKYTNYFPKIRICFCLFYVTLSLILLIYNLATNSYPSDQWYQYILQGGGGECINCLILLIQLAVLRLQLNKQQPYTPQHIYYFFYLAIISLSRLTFTLLNFIQADDHTLNLTLASLLVADSILQLIYWIAKRQSLPQFQNSQTAEKDFLQHESKLIHRRQPSHWKSKNDVFPYIRPLVSIDDSRIRIALQVRSLDLLKQDEVNRSTNKTNNHDSTDPSPFLSPFLSTNVRNDSPRELLSFSHYSLDDIKLIYSTCGRFPLHKQLNFTPKPSLPSLALSLQQFLTELFRQKRYYQPNVLSALHVPLHHVLEYSQLVDKATEMDNDSQVDRTIGLKLLTDTNSIYCSVLIYRQLWVDEHYQFYIKIVLNTNNRHSYAYKRYSEFEQNHQNLKQILKLSGKTLELPTLPKKHLFGWNEENEISQRRIALQKYLKRLCNDCLLMQVPPIRFKILEFLCFEGEVLLQPVHEQQFYVGAKVIKGDIRKTLIGGQYITQYTFKIDKDGKQVEIVKRFSQIEDLHYELERWMHNSQTNNKNISLPEKVIYKSESHRQQKLTHYLQSVLQIKDIDKLYAAKCFFNVCANQRQCLQQGSSSSEKSPIRNQGFNQVLDRDIELARNSVLFSDSEESSRRFSQIMNNLGNQQYD